MAVAFVAQAVTIGLTIIPFGLFATPMVEEFGLSIASVQVGLGLFIVVLTGTSAGIGPLLDRYSIRLFMALGSILMALCFWGMSLAHHPWQLALLFSGGTALGVSLAGPLAATTVIAKWFDEKRGLAVGIAAMGPPTGGLLLTPLAGWLLAEFGWRRNPAGLCGYLAAPHSFGVAGRKKYAGRSGPDRGRSGPHGSDRQGARQPRAVKSEEDHTES